MKKLKNILLCLLCMLFMVVTNVVAAVACTQNQIDIGIECIDTKFTVKTTDMAANTQFKFVLSAAGTFYIDWGDNSAVQTITRTNDTTPTEYYHDYVDGGVNTIKFAGLATEYNTTTYNDDKDSSGAAIRFAAATTNTSTNTGGTPALIAELGGSIGSVFPTLGNNSNQIPIFFDLCQECSSLTTISSDLFSGVTGAKANMFRGIFDKCSSLTTLPDTLFGDISGSAPNMFRSAFYECSSLTTLPAGLFSGINGAQNYMFKWTFAGTTGLTGYIPATLFDGLHGETATELMLNIFANGSGLATSCPSGTQQVITGYESNWSGKVACAPTNPVTCQGATYLVDNTCVACPGGFDYNTTNGKTSINQCQIHCNAGTWTNSYTQLEYLENTGGSYINTGYHIPTTNLTGAKVIVGVSIPMDASTLTNKDTGNFAGNIDTISGHSMNYKKGTFGLWVAKGTSGSKIETASQSFPADTMREVIGEFVKSGNQTNRIITVTGTGITVGANKNTKSGNISDPYTSTNTYKLFNNGCAGGCGDKAFVGRIHYFKLYVNNTLVFDMIPARRNSDDVLGMYDIVSGQFFTNVGTGSFTTSNNNTGTTFGGGTCENVGYGYYSSASTIHYGGVSIREACPNGGITYVENAIDVSECHTASDVPCSAGTYLPANETTCASCPANSYCGGGVFTPDTVDQGIGNCITEIASGWASEAGASAKTDCYYVITLSKNGFSGTITAGAGTGCSVVATVTGTSQAKLKVFYNTVCTLPGINLLQSGFDTATSWATTNAITGDIVTTIPAPVTTPSIKTYYARKTCEAGYYSTGSACSACGSNSGTHATNAETTCTCDTGYSADGTVNGATTSINGCLEKSLTCQSNEFKYIDANSNEACIENKFQITTTNDTDEFVFNMSAKGTFYIDWGDGTVELIDRSNTTTMTEYSHNYASADEYIIKFGGVATEYIRGDSNGYYNNVSCIYFGEPVAGDPANVGRNNTNDKLAEISGSLGALFPTLGTGYANQPRFTSTFRNCTNLQGIPATLFNGITGTATTNMFTRTFYGCSGLRGTNIDDPANPGMKYAIPPNLFSGLSSAPNGGTFYMTFYGCSGLNGTIPGSLFNIPSITPTQSVFHSTFFDCSSLTGPIPSDLFANVSGDASSYTFYYTFRGCSSLSGTNIDDPNNPGMKYAIPPTLFSGITGIPGTRRATFQGTFNRCSGLVGSIPGTLFSSISTSPKESTFMDTFYNCSGLTGKIPSNLFAGISGAPAKATFSGTFSGCTNLTGQIPSDLFENISGAPADSMFYCTFYGCSSLTGSIPGNLFSGISGVPAVSMFNSTFYGCSGLNGTDIDDPSQPGYKYAIPPTLFSGISGAPAKQMFRSTFQSCPGLTGTIPENLFAGVHGKPAPAMFLNTFYGCSGLIGSIPGNLFSSVSGAPESSMFQATFRDCSSLTGPLPGDLFAGIYGKASTQSFYYTFYNCTNLGKDTIGGTSTYYIPPELFAGIDKDSTATEFMNVVFTGTGLLTTCPAGTSQYITGFESYFSGKKSCTQCSVNYPNYDTTNDQCYAQITYIDSDNNTLLKTEDVYYDANYPNGYTLPSYSPTKPDTILDNWENGAGTVIGANDILTGNQVLYSDWGFNCDSGRHFHIANEQVCVAESKRTEHALAIQVDPEHTYYIHATPNSEHDYTINSSSIHKLKADYNGTIYNLHDASVYFSE